ncbi:MAG: RnfABCDGE type electron transport complex subunit D [Nitrospirae bacterium]|nr:RnfABCDGE type electron transport complex subunit D [Nitrospirota bacterium]
MVEAPDKAPATPKRAAQKEAPIEPRLQVAPGPHLSSSGLTTQRLMVDVLIALIPVMAMALYLFRWFAVLQVGICVVSCLAVEVLTSLWRGSRPSLQDTSAIVTGVILGLSLPWSAPWYVGVVASVVAIGFGKAVFGGLGQNIFNPAMVGRAFVMISFASSLGATAYVRSGATLEILTQATPLTAAKELSGSVPGIWTLFVGNANGSLGETSVLACLVGGLYLCLRRSAVWLIPVSLIASAAVVAGIANLLMPETPLTVLQHLTSGALVFSAFFIATDPVTSPLTGRGQVIFGAGLGALVVVIRLFSNYPEGVVFAVLLMNAVVPLINRVTIPKPLGGLPADA